MATDPTRISDPSVRALAREVVALRRELSAVQSGMRATQLGNSSLEGGSLTFNDDAGVQRVSIGRQVDGKFGWGAVNGDPPPRPNTPQLVGTVAGVAITWNGQFAGLAPSDFTHVKAYLSPVGENFIPSDGNLVGHFLGAATMPVTPLVAGTSYWCVLIAYNTSGVASEVSFPAGPAQPTAVVATDILDGIVTELKLADDAVTAAKIAAGAVGTGQIAGNAVDLSKLANGSVDATKIVDGSITPAKLSFSVEDIASIATYFQPDQPTGTITAGSLWADSNDGNKLYRYSGSGWVNLSDTGIANALAAAQAAQTDAANALTAASGAEAAVDGKVTVFYQGTSPSGANTGDLWLNTASNNALQRWSGTAWVAVADARIATALANAATAQSTADGKIDAFYQGTAPATGMGVGDLWYNTSAGNLASRWNGTTWVPLPAGSGALADGAVTPGKIGTGAVTAGTVAANAIGVNELAANSVVAGKIAANAITSTNIVAGGIQTANLAADSVAAGKIAADAITSRELQALSVIAGKIAANAVTAGTIAAGQVTADKLEAILVMANTIIAGNPNDWHLELGDSNTPILYWNGDETGFAVSRDDTTGQANVYMSGRVEFGNGSQIEQDYLDLCEQPATGFQLPKPRQQRSWIDSGPKSAVTPKWVAATQPGSLLLMSVYVVASAGGSGAPAITAPTGWQLVDGVTFGTGKLLLYQMPNTTGSRSSEPFTASLNSRWAFGMFEYTGISGGVSLDKSANASGTGTTASTGTTTTTTQANELQFAVWASPTIGFTNGKGGQFTSPTSGFVKLMESDGTVGHGFAVAAKNATGTTAVSSSITLNKSVAWLGVVATFKAATAAPVPVKPPAKTTRVFTMNRGGKSTPHVVDDAGNVYPVGRVPYCRVYLTANFTVFAADVWAQGNWTVGLDPYGMAAIGTGGVFTNITIPISGSYLVDYKAIFQSSTNIANVGASFVTKGSRVATASIARDVRTLTQQNSDTNADLAPGDKSPVQASRVVPLAAGDVLYWGNWSNASPCTVFAGVSGIPTEISVTYLGPT